MVQQVWIKYQLLWKAGGDDGGGKPRDPGRSEMMTVIRGYPGRFGELDGAK
jgi:hypothetical protein